MTATTNNRKLNSLQTSRLENIVGMDYIIQPAADLPEITVKAQDLIVVLKKKLEEDGFTPKDIRINGSVASVVVGGSKCQTYNDLDILFNFEPDQEPSTDTSYDRTRHDRMRWCVLKCIEGMLPEQHRTGKMNYEKLADMYFQKYVLVQNNKNDLWSLICLRSAVGRSIELKFVDRMKRKYEFSIDSFQLILSENLTFRDTPKTTKSQKSFPNVYVESVYGDYDTALKHLDQQLIATRNPEEIRGGGLLKYCYLKTCRYRDADPESMCQLNKYMCSRFFIDFPDVSRQKSQLEKYLVNHFASRNELKYPFLLHVLDTVQQHAFCLPIRERSRTLEMINIMALQHGYTRNIYAYGNGIYTGVYSSHQPVFLFSREHPDPASSTGQRYRGRGSRHYDPYRQQCLTLQQVYFATPVIPHTTATIS